MNTQYDLIADTTCITGEGPLWHPGEEKLYWCDIPRGDLYCYEPNTGDYDIIYSDTTIGGYTIQTDGSLLLFMDGGVVKRWNGETSEVVDTVLSAESDSRFNDVIADPIGRVYCGTMPTDDRLGRLYRCERDGSFVRLRDEVDIPNGMAFDQSFGRFYFTETKAGRIWSFEYHMESGALTDETLFRDDPTDDGMPDGMTVDEDGYVWSAQWNGNCVKRFAPDGTLDRTIEFPAKKVSSVTFGGTEYRTLYVTTAGGDDRRAEGEYAGAVLAVEFSDEDIRGRPEFRSSILLP